MSATSDEIKIDLDEIDAKAAEKAAAAKTKVAKTDSTGAGDKDPPDIQVSTDDAGDKKDDKQALTPDAGLEKLKKQLDDERIARIDAEKRAQEASEGEARAKGEVQTSQLDLVKNAITTFTQANDALETK